MSNSARWFPHDRNRQRAVSDDPLTVQVAVGAPCRDPGASASAQCPRARFVSPGELANAAEVSTNTITRFERGEELLPRTLDAIRKALEDAGVKFINAEKSGGPGVRLRE